MKDRIKALKKERNAIILAHNYEPPEIQDIADLCGDSLELSIKAADTDADVIVFCGVHFMAETASILSPDKKVLLPVKNAGCPMADMITPEKLKARLAELGDMPVVTYVNSSAAVKAISTICCTSANVLNVVNSIDAREILMTPDRNLAMYAASKINKKIHLWEGYCPFHNSLTVQDVENVKKAYPEAEFIAHPECPPEIVAMADAVLSTSGMLRYAANSKRREYIIGTEIGLLYPLKKACPDKIFYPASLKMECPEMKKIKLEDIVYSLEHMSGEVKVPEDIRVSALKSVQAMLDLSK